MEVHSFFLSLLLILLTARLFGELATRLNLPSVLGELLAGILLGPSLLGWVEPTDIFRLLAEIGIILMLFEVGLGADLLQLVKSGSKSATVAISGVFFPFLFGFSLSYWVFSFSLLQAFFIGGTLTATSIGITVRVLTDIRLQHAVEGQVVLGAAVLDDVVGIVLLAMLYEFSTRGGISLMNAGTVFLFIVVYFLLAPIAAKLISLFINHIHSRTEMAGLIPTSIVSLVLFFAWVAHTIGAPELMGGFAAGLALSRRFFMPFGIALHSDRGFSHRIEAQMKPIIRLFTPIFFVVVGLSLNLHELDWHSPKFWLFSLSLFLVAALGKLLGPFLLRQSWPSRWLIGLAMVPRAEVGLVFAELGHSSGILGQEIYAGLIFVIALTTLLPPVAMKWIHRRYRISEKKQSPEQSQG